MPDVGNFLLGLTHGNKAIFIYFNLFERKEWDEEKKAHATRNKFKNPILELATIRLVWHRSHFCLNQLAKIYVLVRREFRT